MKFDAVIFDLDGVICSTDEYHYKAWKIMADGMGIPFDRTVNNRLRGVSRMASLEIILEKYKGPALSPEQKEDLAREKNDLYRESLREMSTADLPEEVKETLDALRSKGLKLAIGSSSKNTPFILGQIGLGNYFVRQSGGNAGNSGGPVPGGGRRGFRRRSRPPGRHDGGLRRGRREERRGGLEHGKHPGTD